MGLKHNFLTYCIIMRSKWEGEVCEYITRHMHHGAIILDGKPLAGSERKNLYCIVHISKLQEFKYSVKKIDKDALISIIDVAEVEGKGFDSNIS